MKSLRPLTLLPFLLSAPLISPAKPQVIPVVNLEFYGGQTRFDGDDGDFYGNGAWSLAPVVRFSDKSMLIPSYSGMLRRSVMVEELIGGALLTQSQQDHVFNVKGVRQLGDSPWKGKARIGYKKQLLRETKDEGWGDGLFDYDKWVTGVEFEREGVAIRSFRSSLEYFILRYPNFDSLASGDFGGEIDQGSEVLDLNAFDWLTSLEWAAWKRGFLSFSVLLSPRFYTDAKVIEDTGLFSSDKRNDTYYWGAGNLTHSFGAVFANSLKLKQTLGLGLSLIRNDSNQNNFDADQTRFNENYYSYNEWQMGPRWGGQFFDRWNLNVAYNFTQRLYDDRPVQSKTGTYTSGTINNEIQLYTGTLSYALTKSFSLNLNAAYQVAKSNNKYEQTYRYNYDSAHFFFGIRYAN